MYLTETQFDIPRSWAQQTRLAKLGANAHQEAQDAQAARWLVPGGIFLRKYATEAEAQRRCDELNGDETDSRFSYMPFSQWKKDAIDKTCGIRPWTTREQDEAAIEYSCSLHEDLNPTQ